MRLDPILSNAGGDCIGAFFRRPHAEASSLAEQASLEHPDLQQALRAAAASRALAGRLQEAVIGISLLMHMV
jgi:hypothetical protein